MVQFLSTTVLGLVVVALGASAAPTNKDTSDVKVITLDDVKNSEPKISGVSDPAKKIFSSKSGDNTVLLEGKPELAKKVEEAKKEIPALSTNDEVPKNATKMARRDLEKRSNEECYVFTSNPPSTIQATPAALTFAIKHACKAWYPDPNIAYFVPETSDHYANYFGHLAIEEHVHRADTPYWNTEYYATSQNICISELSWLVFLVQNGYCAGDFSGITSENDPNVAFWYSWKTY